MTFEEIASKFNDIKKTIESFYSVINADEKNKRIDEIEQLSIDDPDFWSKQESKHILKEQSNLRKFLSEWNKLKQLSDDVDTFIELYKEDDSILQDLGQSFNELESFISDFEMKLILNNDNDSNNAILTIHSGAGGTEANDWAQMLYRMYCMWSEKHKFKYEILDFIQGDEAGVKSVTMNIIGDYCYGYLKGETGVHRLVRLSPFDANNKRHTSFASVFVLPEIDDDIEININETELKIDTFRAGGAGGQHVNTTDSAVRITHLPTGTVVSCQNERSQHKNKAHAMKILRSKLYELEIERKNKEKNALENSKTDIGWGNQIRSYVMHPYKMVKDLRTREETGNVDAFMDGGLDTFIKSYLLYTAGISNE